MKSHVVGIRLNEKEIKLLSAQAKKAGRSTSSFIKDLVLKKSNEQFDEKKQNMATILSDQSQLLIQLNSQVSKILRHDILMSTSTLQNRYVLGKFLNLVVKIYHNKWPSDFSIPTNEEKDAFLEEELKKIRQEIEEIP